MGKGDRFRTRNWFIFTEPRPAYHFESTLVAISSLLILFTGLTSCYGFPLLVFFFVEFCWVSLSTQVRGSGGIILIFLSITRYRLLIFNGNSIESSFYFRLLCFYWILMDKSGEIVRPRRQGHGRHGSCMKGLLTSVDRRRPIGRRQTRNTTRFQSSYPRNVSRPTARQDGKPPPSLHSSALPHCTVPFSCFFFFHRAQIRRMTRSSWLAIRRKWAALVGRRWKGEHTPLLSMLIVDGRIGRRSRWQRGA